MPSKSDDYRFSADVKLASFHYSLGDLPDIEAASEDIDQHYFDSLVVLDQVECVQYFFDC